MSTTVSAFTGIGLYKPASEFFRLAFVGIFIYAYVYELFIIIDSLINLYTVYIYVFNFILYFMLCPTLTLSIINQTDASPPPIISRQPQVLHGCCVQLAGCVVVCCGCAAGGWRGAVLCCVGFASLAVAMRCVFACDFPFRGH
jgi:hypothetical protein